MTWAARLRLPPSTDRPVFGSDRKLRWPAATSLGREQTGDAGGYALISGEDCSEWQSFVLSTPWLDSALKRQCFTSPRQTSAMVRQRGGSPPLRRRFTSSDRLQNFTARVAAMESSNNDGGFKPRTAAVQWRHKLLDFFSDDPPLIELRSNNSSVTAILVGLFAACRWQNSTAKLLALFGGSSTMVTR